MSQKLLLVVVVTMGTFSTAAAEKNPPNMIYIMADELGYYELSCMGHPYIQTPFIDQMAKEGVRFTQGLAGSAICAPTRCVLMTGKHSGHSSIRNNGAAISIRAEEKTIASVLRDAGYATGGFGKWGCGGRGSTGVPEKHGFDEFVGYYDQTHAHTYYPPYIIRNSEEVPLEGNTGKDQGRTYSHYEIVNQAKEFIRRNREKPFFCYMPITPPHGSFSIPDGDPAWKQYADKPWPPSAKRYAAMVTMVDRQVGEILSLLKELGLDDNTLVVFCGDNGGNDYFKDSDHPRGFHAPNVDPKSGVAFRGKKGNLYEGGLRIPMIVRWPGHVEAGRISDFLWYFPDVMPTFAELASAKLHGDVDGLSIVPELIGEQMAGRRQKQHEFLYWEIGKQAAVRMGDWKAIRPTLRDVWELYDLGKDISETTDVSRQHPDILEKMKQHAKRSSVPMESGTFSDQDNHMKDRLAKSGGKPVKRGKNRKKQADAKAKGKRPTRAK